MYFDLLLDKSPSIARECQAGSKNYRKQFHEWCQKNNIVPIKEPNISSTPSTLGQHWYSIAYTFNGQTGTFVSGCHPRKKDAEEEASSRAVQHERLKRACDSLGKTPKKLLQEYGDKSHVSIDFRAVPQQQFQSEVIIKGTSAEAVVGDVFQNKTHADHSASLRALHKFGIL